MMNNKIKQLSNKWWMGLILIVLFFIPPISQVPFNSQDVPFVIGQVLSFPYAYQSSVIYIALKITFLILFTALLVKKDIYTKVFNGYTVLLLLGVSITQNIANTNDYGTTFLLGNFILTFIVAVMWLWQMFSNQQNTLKEAIGWNKYWLIALALLAFWFPEKDTLIHMTPGELILNEAMVTFCMIVPVILTIAVLTFKRINVAALKIISFIGIIFGLTNMITWFLMNSGTQWMGVLHLPLLLISIYVFIITRKVMKNGS